MKVLNAFSIQMVTSLLQDPGFGLDVRIERISLDMAKKLAADGVESAVGHQDIAAVISEQLGVTVPANRVNVQLAPREEVLVGQYVGGRLPEGATTLPEGARIDWFLVSIGE